MEWVTSTVQKDQEFILPNRLSKTAALIATASAWFRPCTPRAIDVTAAAAAAQKKADDTTRAARAEAVTGIETSIKTMADEHLADGLIDGPILDVSCSPTNGGSTDDLTAQTTVFECFVSNKDNGDGTHSGYYYNATMNWTTGSYTYGFGRD